MNRYIIKCIIVRIQLSFKFYFYYVFHALKESVYLIMASQRPSRQFSSQHSQNSNRSSEHSYRSPQQRKEALRNVYANVQALQGTVNTKTLENLENIVNEVDIINEESTIEDKVNDQGVVLLDSEIMTISSNVLHKCTCSLSKDISRYDPNEFAEKIKHFLLRLSDTVLEEEPTWSLIGADTFKFFHRTSGFSMMLGTFQTIPKKEVVKRTRVVAEAQKPTKRPENVVTLDKVEDSVEQTVVEIKRIIGHYQKRTKQAMDFFKLVLHPTDFGKTVENILHVSFLVRDGYVKFSKGEDGLLYVQKSSKDEVAEVKNNKKMKNIQNVLSITMQQWKTLVEVYGIETPMIDIQLNA
ncbi:non-structural maintenance of chromosomes element 4 homolog A isoform X1 [Trichogramma pretiosum]|uniref:non-structural maintenance of chromosomes element 4 homolog A isoform X1 n=2 Tax=Trichogramma pretiosum TaxID=7493 RepID=UPI000C71A709|nr:non-structural maintenance of chromosomes element 4 homolog A isoform X1 [Trichogramma pretiosum]